MNGRGVLITLEGCDGCGKSTQAALLCERLAACGLPVGPAAAPGTVVREPGGTAAGEAIRELLLDGPPMSEWTETLLYAAARAELVEQVLLPSLDAGRVVVMDRYIDSSLVYQGIARGLGVDVVLDINKPGLRGLMPDLTIVLRIDPVVALARQGGSKENQLALLWEASDRIDAEGLEFQQSVERGYATIAERFSRRVRAIDGCRDVAAVARDVWAAALEAVAAAGLRLAAGES